MGGWRVGWWVKGGWRVGMCCVQSVWMGVGMGAVMSNDETGEMKKRNEKREMR